ncbi:MAG: substrate-binding domain-containing protein [Caldilineaceae bacterium]|nr:substrate-binding domain-containing protein [Caldilineaceae bacterium]
MPVRRRVWFLFGLIAILALALGACAAPVTAPTDDSGSESASAEAAATEAPAEESEGEAAAGDAPTIALVYGVAGDGFYITMERGLREAAEAAGVNAVADGPSQFDPVQQTPILDAMVARGVDAICIAATDKQAMVEPMQRANDAGIPIISVDTFVGDGDYENGPVTFPLSYVGSDNVEGGRIACNALIDNMGGEGKIYIQNVKPGVSTTDQREQGCREAIEATNGAVELVGVDYNDDSAAVAAEQTAAVLQREPDLGAVFGANLFSAQGAAQAVANAGLTGVVRVANFDAPEAAIEDLRNEVVDIVIAQLPYEMGQKCVEYSLMALDGNVDEIPARWPTGYVEITRDNVDSEEAQNAIYSSN